MNDLEMREMNACFFTDFFTLDLCQKFYELGYRFEIEDGEIKAIELINQR